MTTTTDTTIGDRFRSMKRAAIIGFGTWFVRTIAKFLANQSLIGDPEFFDKSIFPETDLLEKNTAVIRKELDEVLKTRELIPGFQEISPDQVEIATGENWKTFILYGFGFRAEKNCERCPETVKILEQIPNLKNAWFSILAPGYHIPPHMGVTKGLVRIHLGLIIPREKEKCRIRVGSQTRHWEEGQCMVFDDTFEHEVWNETDEERTVLFLDVVRPLKTPGRLLNNFFLWAIRKSAYVQDGRRNTADFEERFEAAVRRADGYTDPGS